MSEFTREQALAIFGVTPEELAAADHDERVALRAAKDLSRSDFEKFIRERLQADFDAAFDGALREDILGRPR